MDFKEAQTERREGERRGGREEGRERGRRGGREEGRERGRRGGSRANPDLLSGHQGRNKASAAMQIPQVHRPINAVTTARGLNQFEICLSDREHSENLK